jgi:hypothetical protein
MNRRILFVGLFAAMPGILTAQEYKLVNCRTLEAAGNFIGSDEVLNGDMVCQKVKAGAAVPAREGTAQPMPGAVITGSESMNVVEAPKAGAKTAGPVKDPAAGLPGPAKSMTAPAVSGPDPEPLPAEPQPPTPKEPATASATVSVATPSTPTVPPTQLHRDAPVAEGTPSAPPEKDYGFSDANAVEPPNVAIRADNTSAEKSSAKQNAARNVQVGGFAKPAAEAADMDSPAQSTNFAPSDTAGFQEGQRAGCTKNITLGSLRDKKLVLGTPAWAQKWIEKNQERLAKTCFSAAPMGGAQNYLIVFYTMAGSSQPSNAMPLPDAASSGDTGGFTTKYGSMWHYVVDSKVGTTVLTKDVADELQSEQPTWYATAYAEDGTPIAERWPERGKDGAKKENERASEELLGLMVEDLRKL